jgi:hypothetical protein
MTMADPSIVGDTGKNWFKDQPKGETRIVSSLNGARDFIWKHWQEKKPGYFRISLNGVDATSTSHIFIEPDAKGDWQITWRIVRNHALVKGGFVNDVPVIRKLRKSTISGILIVDLRLHNPLSST